MTNNDDLKKKQEEFINSCTPLEEMLDGVRDIEGFPIGKDEDILALSDAPWYTACPNPYINKFIEIFGTPYDEATDDYERKPFVSDVSEGKNDPIYNVHSYHTKVPHKAIMKFIKHYTDENDIVFDGFCGTGMTGVAAQQLNRFSITGDLSPIATFISYNLNKYVDLNKFNLDVGRIIKEAEKECGWLYETLHSDKKSKGKIVYTIFSEVMVCPYCKNEFALWDASVDFEKQVENKIFSCPNCEAELKKSDCERSLVEYNDPFASEIVLQTKQVPVLISYSLNNQRFWKKPDYEDIKLINKLNLDNIPYWFPSNPMMNIGENWGDTWRAGYHSGVSSVHHFYTVRNLWILSKLYDTISKINDNRLHHFLIFYFTSLYSRTQKMNRYMPAHNRHVGPLSGTLYLSSYPVEINVLNVAQDKKASFSKLNYLVQNRNISSVQSLTDTSKIMPDSCVDYIFTDPPFGDNLMYSELNFIMESWLKVCTNISHEAIINSSQMKDLSSYKGLILDSFKECYRILKPNRWITVEFHNSKAAVWNAIQDSLNKAGFVIAQVAIIDKQKGTTKQLSYAGAVNKDLVINAYKPKQQFEERFLKTAGEGLERDFIEQHLDHLPVEPNIERSEQMLFSKMLAHYVQHGYEIKLNAKQFYNLLRDNFKMMDGFWFTDSQVREYDEWKKEHGLKAIEEISKGQQTLFVNDEKSALIWLYNFLNGAKTYSDILTAYNQVVTSIDDDIPELQTMLQTNFVFENGVYRRPLNEKEKEAKEEQSEKELLRAFDRILNEAKTNKKKIKTVRKEAIKLGFTKAYQEKRFYDIVAVADRLDKDILESNSEITDFVDIARMKMGDDF